jgi:hypothetical protein
MAVVRYDANILLMAFSFQFQRAFDMKLAVIVSNECSERLFSVLKLLTKKHCGATKRYFSCMPCTLPDILIKGIFACESKHPLIFHIQSPVILMIVKSGEVR